MALLEVASSTNNVKDNAVRTSKMDILRKNVMTAALSYNLPTLNSLTTAWPIVLQERNQWGETPLEEYQRLGWQSTTVIAHLTPCFEPDWVMPTWYGTAGAWNLAGW